MFQPPVSLFHNHKVSSLWAIHTSWVARISAVLGLSNGESRRLINALQLNNRVACRFIAKISFGRQAITTWNSYVVLVRLKVFGACSQEFEFKLKIKSQVLWLACFGVISASSKGSSTFSTTDKEGIRLALKNKTMFIGANCLNHQQCQVRVPEVGASSPPNSCNK